MADERILSVWELNSLARQVLQSGMGEVRVAGEVTDVSRPSSGHIYLTLKDARAQLRAVLWRSTASRLPFSLEDGMSVIGTGELDIYPPRGSYQLVIRQLVPQGEGALQLALRQLHAKLAAEGLFEPSRKRPLPRYPRWIAVVTSPTGAAVHDFLEVVRRRWTDVRITVVPARVQGEGASSELVAGIRCVHRWRPRPDVLVLTRGGGSLEDLWCFNDERLVRTVAAAEIPVVSAVGHDIDVTLCDLAADVRALTPTEAGERVVPDQREVCQALESLTARLRHGAERTVKLARQRLERFAHSPAFRRPLDPLRDRQRRLDELQLRAQRAVQGRIGQLRHVLGAAAGRLESLSPLAVLARGYTVTWDKVSGRLVNRAEQARTGMHLLTQCADGRITSRVEGIERAAGLPSSGSVAGSDTHRPDSQDSARPPTNAPSGRRSASRP